MNLTLTRRRKWIIARHIGRAGQQLEVRQKCAWTRVLELSATTRCRDWGARHVHCSCCVVCDPAQRSPVHRTKEWPRGHSGPCGGRTRVDREAVRSFVVVGRLPAPGSRAGL